MASMTAAPSTEMRKARPHDVRLMPHMLQAFHRDVAVSKAKAITNDHDRRIKSCFKQDGVAIKDMVSEEYLAMVKQLRPKDCKHMTALRSFSAWFQTHGLTFNITWATMSTLRDLCVICRILQSLLV